MADEFLGTGWRFPILPDRDGRLGYVSGENNVEQSLLVLVQTAVGERLMRPDFGTRVAEMVFAPGSLQHLAAIESTIREAVLRFEPRVDVEDLTTEVDPEDRTRVTVILTYRVRQTNSRRNLVHPFLVDYAEVAP